MHRYPISIEWPPAPLATAAERRRRAARACASASACRATTSIGVGVDRLDYTKGILERFNAVARLLELEPQWIGRFTFVQIAAPTRGTIDDYRDYAARVRALADEINARYRATRRIRRSSCSPSTTSPTRSTSTYRAADVCFVSSLHDGMNLVAKEFVAARDDEQGVLILSQFAGASRELPEALIVNPYDADQCAAALQLALTMPADEQRARMRLHARRRPRVQRLPLGGPHAARRRGDAPARALPRRRSASTRHG